MEVSVQSHSDNMMALVVKTTSGHLWDNSLSGPQRTLMNRIQSRCFICCMKGLNTDADAAFWCFFLLVNPDDESLFGCLETLFPECAPCYQCVCFRTQEKINKKTVPLCPHNEKECVSSRWKLSSWVFEDCEAVLRGYLSFPRGCALANSCHLSKQTEREMEGVAAVQTDSRNGGRGRKRVTEDPENHFFFYRTPANRSFAWGMFLLWLFKIVPSRELITPVAVVFSVGRYKRDALVCSSTGHRSHFHGLCLAQGWVSSAWLDTPNCL